MNILETTKQYLSLDATYQFFNEKLFAGKLPSCFITLQRKNCEGYFSPKKFRNKLHNTRTDEIALNPDRFCKSELYVLSTIVHEMCHLWQSHFGNPTRASYHNHEWSRKMEMIGLMPSSTGEPGGRRVGQRMSDYVIENGPFSRCTDELLKERIIFWESEDLSQTRKDIKQIKGNVFEFDDLVNLSSESLIVINGSSYPIESLDKENNCVRVKGFESGSGAPEEVFVLNKKGKGSEKTKVKYSCPRCGLNVWGKKELYILCGACKQQLITEDDLDDPLTNLFLQVRAANYKNDKGDKNE